MVTIGLLAALARRGSVQPIEALRAEYAGGTFRDLNSTPSAAHERDW